MKAHHKENTVYTVILLIVLSIIAFFALSASKSLEGLAPELGSWQSLPEIIGTPLAKLGISGKDLQPCLNNAETQRIIDQDVAEAGATGTPLFYISSKDFTYRMVGAIPADMLSQIIDSLQAGNPLAIPSNLADVFALVPEGSPELAFMELRPTDAIFNTSIQNPTVTIIEYGDLSCPACKYAHQELKTVLAKEPTVQFVYRHHPLTSIHPLANNQAKYAICIQKLEGYEAFWGFVDMTYKE